MPSPWDRISADLEDFGRRQPLAVMGLGGVAGFVASRFVEAPSPERYEAAPTTRRGRR